MVRIVIVNIIMMFINMMTMMVMIMMKVMMKTPTLTKVFCSLSFQAVSTLHGCPMLIPTSSVNMNDMDRHIQQTNDRLMCIKQVRSHAHHPYIYIMAQ